MKYFKFKDKNSEIIGIIISELDEDRNLSVKFYSEEEGCFLYRFRKFNEVDLIEINQKDYELLRKS